MISYVWQCLKCIFDVIVKATGRICPASAAKSFLCGSVPQDLCFSFLLVDFVPSSLSLHSFSGLLQ